MKKSKRANVNVYQYPSKLALYLDWIHQHWTIFLLIMFAILIFQAGLFQWNRNDLVNMNKLDKVYEEPEGIELRFVDGKRFYIPRDGTIAWEYVGGVQ